MGHPQTPLDFIFYSIGLYVIGRSLISVTSIAGFASSMKDLPQSNYKLKNWVRSLRYPGREVKR